MCGKAAHIAVFKVIILVLGVFGLVKTAGEVGPDGIINILHKRFAGLTRRETLGKTAVQPPCAARIVLVVHVIEQRGSKAEAVIVVIMKCTAKRDVDRG